MICLSITGKFSGWVYTVTGNKPRLLRGVCDGWGSGRRPATTKATYINVVKYGTSSICSIRVDYSSPAALSDIYGLDSIPGNPTLRPSSETARL
jgi:hypothetical protein